MFITETIFEKVASCSLVRWEMNLILTMRNFVLAGVAYIFIYTEIKERRVLCETFSSRLEVTVEIKREHECEKLKCECKTSIINQSKPGRTHVLGSRDIRVRYYGA